MKSLLLSLTFCFTCILISAQGQDYDAFQARNAFYFEFGGQTWGTSLNYERRYSLSEVAHLNWHVGVSFDNYRFAPAPSFVDNFSLPIGITTTFGKQEHQLEVGLGTTLRTQFDFGSGGNNTSNPTFEGGVKFMGVPHIGYRYQHQIGGVVIRVIYSPIYRYLVHPPAILWSNKWNNWFGLSIGWALKNVGVG